MRGFCAVYRRELAGLFLAPLAWILFCVTLFYNAFFFLHYLRDATGGEVNAALGFLLGGAWPFWFLVMFVPPLVTMRMISEESRSGVLEFLLTAPVTDAAVILGKALAATTFLALVWASVACYALAVQLLGAPPDWGVLFTSWLGATLVSALFVSIGLVASALSSTPLVAAFVATMANILVIFLPQSGRRTSGLGADLLHSVIAKVDVIARFQGSFMTGAIDSAHVVFYAAWIGAFLFLAVRLVETRRWL